MDIQIKRGAAIFATISPDTAVLSQKIMSDDAINIAFRLPNSKKFQIGDYFEYNSNIYTLNQLPAVNKMSARNYSYTAVFESVKYDIAKVNFLMLGDDNSVKEPDFSVTGKLDVFLSLVVRNLNRAQSGWSMGDVDDLPAQTISFNGQNCLAAMATIAEAFKTEYWVLGKTIHFTKKGGVSGVEFQYGKAKGLRSLSRANVDSSNIFTRILVYGSTENIPADYRNLQKRLRISAPYLEQNTDKYGVIEAVRTYEDIRPEREGVVSAVNGKYEIIDSAIDFDVNAQLIGGVAAKITFNTGQLAGYVFEIVKFNNATKSITFNPNEDEKALQVPSDLLKAAVGDKYVLTDISMPQAYITSAEARLQARALEDLNEGSAPRVQYTATPDPLYFKSQNIRLKIGDTVVITDADLGLNGNLRINGLTYDLVADALTAFELSNTLQPTAIVRQYAENLRRATAITRIESTTAENRRIASKNLRELQEKVFDTDGYFTAENIKPLSISTKMLAVGARSQDFNVADLRLDNTVDTITYSSAMLNHNSIDDNGVRSWNIAASTINGLDSGFYYLYVKCQRVGNNANIVAVKTPLKFDADAVYWHFELGGLSSVVNAARQINPTYGSTIVNGRFIRTGRIQSVDGNTYFDLDTGEIGGNIRFTSAQKSDLISGVEVGGRNLVLKSDTAQTQSVGFIRFPLSEALKSGKYVCTVWYNSVQENSSAISFGADVWEGDHYTYFQIPAGVTKQVYHIDLNDKPNRTAIFIYVNSTTTVSKIKLERGTTATDWTPAPEDVQTDAQARATAAQNAAIATAAMDAQQRATAAQQAALSAAQAFSTAQDNLRATELQAYADGVVTAEEQARINADAQTVATASADAQAKAEAARQAAVTAAAVDAQNRVNTIQVGGRNLVLKSDKAHSGYWWLDGWVLSEAIKSGKYAVTLEYEGTIANGAGFSFGVSSDVVDRDSNYIWFPQFQNGGGKITQILEVNYTTERRGMFIYANNQTTIKRIKIERGTIATDWTPAPEDVEADFQSVKNTAQTLANKTNFLSETAISGNNVATGVLQVGNNYDGANAFISGFGAYAFGAGASFANGANAPFRVTRQGDVYMRKAIIESRVGTTQSGFTADNGIMTWTDNQGRKRMQIGFVDNVPTFTIFAATGEALLELGAQGLSQVNYVQESWSLRQLFKLSQTSQSIDVQAAQTEVYNAIVRTVMESQNGDFTSSYRISFYLQSNNNAYLYSAGTHPNSSQYKTYEGYKTSGSPNRTTNIADGWYGLSTGTLYDYYNQPDGRQTYEFPFALVFIQGGKVVQSQSVQITK